jgi:hypothetical protein
VANSRPLDRPQPGYKGIAMTVTEPDWLDEHPEYTTPLEVEGEYREWADKHDAEERAAIIQDVMSPIAAQQESLRQAAFVAMLERNGWG